MEQKRTSFGAMPDLNESDQQKVAEALKLGAQKSAAATLPALEMFVKLQQNRVKRLDAESKQLKDTLGVDHPRVLAAEKIAKSQAVFKEQMDAQVKRVDHLPGLKPNEWSVSGRVLDPAGKPAAGLIINVLDRDRKYDDLLGETTTDEFGDFHVIYHERDFKEMGENLPELYLTVKDAAGNELFSSRDTVRYNAGRVEYFLIQLGEKPAAPKKAKTRKS